MGLPAANCSCVCSASMGGPVYGVSVLHCGGSTPTLCPFPPFPDTHPSRHSYLSFDPDPQTGAPIPSDSSVRTVSSHIKALKKGPREAFKALSWFPQPAVEEDKKDLVYRLHAEMCFSRAQAGEGQLEAGGWAPSPWQLPVHCPDVPSCLFTGQGQLAFYSQGQTHCLLRVSPVIRADPMRTWGRSGKHQGYLP